MRTQIELDDNTQKFIDTLHRGGKHRFTQDLSGKYSTTYWSKVSEPLCLPPDHHGAAIYFSINPTIVRVTDADRAKYPHFSDDYIERRVASKDATIACINCLFREYDGKDFAPSHETFAEDVEKYKAMALDHVSHLGPEPSVIVDSGGGYQCYWLLDKTAFIQTPDDRLNIKGLQRRWVEMDKRADQNVKDIRRIFRLPGTKNYKDVYAPGFPTVSLIKKDF